MSEEIWKKWCRLCGKDSSEVDVFLKLEDFSTLAETIQKFFAINIYTYDEAPTKICKQCFQFLCEIINYFIQAHKVQEMFGDLQFNDKFNISVDLDEIKIKYGIDLKQDNKSKYSAENAFCLSKNNVDFNKKCVKENRNFLFSNLEMGTIQVLSEEIIVEEDIIEDDLSEITIDEDAFTKNNNDFQRDSQKSDNEKNVENALMENIDIKKSYKKKQKFYRKREKHKKNSQKNLNRKEPVAECELCNKKFLNKGGYTFHLKAKHSLTIEPEPCKFCSKLFKTTSDRQKHELTHLPPEDRKLFPCLHCDKRFYSEGNLNAHIKIVHIREKSFICEECGKGYVTVDALNSHKVVHSEDKPFKCSKCPKSFKRLPTLKLHLESHENRKFICSICGTQLSSRALLMRHMVVHSDEKKYKCNFCEKEFKRPDAFKHHLILHTGLKPYECPFCELTFANGSNCRKHQKTAHPIELAAAEAKGVKRVCKNVPKIEQLRAVNNGALTENQDCEIENVEIKENLISISLFENSVKSD